MEAKIHTGQILFFSNGENLVDYRIDGASGGVGDRTKNLFDGNFLQGYWAYADGVFTPSNTWICTPKLPCKSGEYYTFQFDNTSRWYGFVWYDADGEYISTTNQENNSNIPYRLYYAEAPSNAEFMVVDIASYPSYLETIFPIDVTDFMLVEGQYTSGTMPSYEPYGYKIPVICGRTNNLFYKQIPSANISANGVVVSVTGYNLNIAAVTAGKTYSYSNFVGGGVYGFFSDEPAIGSTTYNSSRQLLSVEYGQITIPAGTNYVAFRSPSATENLMLNQGDTVLPYEPYGGVTTNIYLDEPLYEDDFITFSMVQVNIPTNNGQNTLTVDTQVKPSKIMVKTNEGVFQNPPENKSFSYYYYNLKMDTRNEILRAWATKDNGRIVPKSWNHVQFLVKHGLHKDVFHIGDELVCKRGNGDIVWQIIGMDIDEPTDPQYKHSLTLCMRDSLPNDTVAFSARQALFYFPDGLSAGTYYFTITEHTWVASDVNKSFYFTLISDIPKKGQIVLQNAQNVSCENKTLKIYSSSTSTTEIETATMYLWDSSIEATFLGNVNNSLQTNINCLQRAFLGNNNYKESHIRQWINGGEKATLVYQPQTVFDRPPRWNNTNVGLLKGMDNDFLKVVQSTKVKTARNTLTDGGGSDITEDKFFLLSKPQVYGGNTASNIDEGNVYPYFKNYSSLNAASIDTDKNRTKTKNGSATWWWLRSPYVSYGSFVWFVDANGYMSGDYATDACGVAAACNIFG